MDQATIVDAIAHLWASGYSHRRRRGEYDAGADGFEPGHCRPAVTRI